eukprot:m.19030 g.19030  ORF g.19030 m.19030 type:complete len:431 (+) comp5056_c0_seq1:67-1359(+)
MTRAIDSKSWKLVEECSGKPYAEIVENIHNVKRIFCDTEVWEIPTRELLEYIDEVAQMLDCQRIHFAAEGVGLFAKCFHNQFGKKYEKIVASDYADFTSTFYPVYKHNIAAVDRWCVGQGTLLVVVWPHHAFNTSLLQGLQLNAYEGFLSIGEISHLGTCLKREFVEEVQGVGMKRISIANKKSLSFFDHPHCKDATGILQDLMPGDSCTRSVQELFVFIHDTRKYVDTPVTMYNRRLQCSNWWACFDILCSLKEENAFILVSNLDLVFDCIRIIIGSLKPPDFNHNALLSDEQLGKAQVMLKKVIDSQREDIEVLSKLLHCVKSNLHKAELKKWKPILRRETLLPTSVMMNNFKDIKKMMSTTPEGYKCCAACFCPEKKLPSSAKLQPCTSCNTVAYCSGKCQHFHWPSHKSVCKSANSEVLEDVVGKH